MHRKIKMNDVIISLLISLLTVFIRGYILINSQTLGNMNTYSGGFPISWFEFYYPSNVKLSIDYIYLNFRNHFKIDLFALFLNTLVIMSVINLLKKTFHYFHNKRHCIK